MLSKVHILLQFEGNGTWTPDWARDSAILQTGIKNVTGGANSFPENVIYQTQVTREEQQSRKACI